VIREGVLELGAAINPAGGFSYQVPAQLLLQANPNVDLMAPTSASLPGGGDLPSWLTYQPTTRTFTASEPPANALPFQAQINVRTSTGQQLSLPVLIAQP
jgi:large repetitive protein